MAREALPAALPAAVSTLLLIPVGIVGIFVFMLLLGALALGIALSLISAITWLFRLPGRLLTGRSARQWR